MSFSYVVIVGLIFGNKTIHGPFDSRDRADFWARCRASNQHYEIVRLEPN